MDKIKGYIDHLIFRNSDNGYTVMVVNHEGEELTCVGTFPVYHRRGADRSDRVLYRTCSLRDTVPDPEHWK